MALQDACVRLALLLRGTAEVQRARRVAGAYLYNLGPKGLGAGPRLV